MTKKIYVSYSQMHGYVHEIIRQMDKDQWKPDYVVGLTRGGLLPAVLISQYLDVPMHTLKVSLRDGADDDCESNAWMAEDAFKHGINILIVDDINDTGATISWIKEDWKSGCFPNDNKWMDSIWGNNVRFAVVVDNLASKECVSYRSTEINKDEDPSWIVFPVEDWWLDKSAS